MGKSRKQRRQQSSTDAGRADVHINRARRLLDDGNAKRAQEELALALRCEPRLDVAPERARLHVLEGRRFAAQGDWVSALGEFEAARAASPEASVAFRQIVRSHVELGNVEKAIDFGLSVLRGADRPIDGAVAVIRAMAVAGREEEARQIVEELAMQVGESERRWLDGVTALRAGRFEVAAERFGTIADGDDGSRALLAVTRMRSGDLDAATAAIDAVAETELRGTLRILLHGVTHDRAQLERSRLEAPERYRKLRARTTALDALEATLATDGVHEAAHEFERIDRDARALADYRGIAASIYTIGANAAMREGEPSCAIDFLARAQRLRSDDLEFHFNLLIDTWASWADEFEGWARATAGLVERKAAEEPERWPPEQVAFTKGEIGALVGLHHHGQNRPLRARAEFEKAQKLAARSRYTLELSGRLLYDAADPASAVRSFEDAIAAGGEVTEVNFKLIDAAYVALGEHDKAREFRRRHGAAVGEAPASPIAVDTLLHIAVDSGIRAFLADVTEAMRRDRPSVAPALDFILSIWPADAGSGKVRSTVTRDRLEEFLKAAPSSAVLSEWLQMIGIVLPQFWKTPIIKKLIAYVDERLVALGDDPAALRARTVIALASKKDGTTIRTLAAAALTRAESKTDELVELQRYAHVFRWSNVFRTEVLDALRRDPENPRLLWAASHIDFLKAGSDPGYGRGFDIARRLQDHDTLDLYRVGDVIESAVNAMRFAALRPSSGLHPPAGAPSRPVDVAAAVQARFRELASGVDELDFDAWLEQFLVVAVLDPDVAIAAVRREKIPQAIRGQIEQMIRVAAGLKSLY